MAAALPYISMCRVALTSHFCTHTLTHARLAPVCRQEIQHAVIPGLYFVTQNSVVPCHRG